VKVHHVSPGRRDWDTVHSFCRPKEKFSPAAGWEEALKKLHKPKIAPRQFKQDLDNDQIFNQEADKIVARGKKYFKIGCLILALQVRQRSFYAS